MATLCDIIRSANRVSARAGMIDCPCGRLTPVVRLSTDGAAHWLTPDEADAVAAMLERFDEHDSDVAAILAHAAGNLRIRAQQARAGSLSVH